MERGVQINFTLTNRWLYTLISLTLILIVSVGVYALTPGVSENPGHLIDNVAPPSGCSNGQVLQFIDLVTGWGCISILSGQWTKIDSDIYYSEGNVGIGKSPSGAMLDVDGKILGTDGRTTLYRVSNSRCETYESKVHVTTDSTCRTKVSCSPPTCGDTWYYRCEGIPQSRTRVWCDNELIGYLH